MNSAPHYSIEPWCVRETSLDLDRLAQSEAVFALANGHIGLRANLDEGEPHSVPGTYLNSFYELRPLPYAEAGYGYPESGQTIVNVTNGKPMRLLVDDEPFDVRYGDLRSHERVLDLRSGTLERSAGALDPPGVVHAAVDRRDLLRSGAGRRPGPDHPAVRAGGERGDAADAR
jgi:alpha,alpha-trehalose phosphorylase